MPSKKAKSPKKVTKGGRRSSKVHVFLRAIREVPNVSRAAKAAGIDRSLHYKRLKADPVYFRAFEECWTVGVDALEDEAVRRAQLGVLEPVYYKGRIVGAKAVYSDRLMEFLLKGAKPEKYRERFEHKAPSLDRFSGTLDELLATFRSLTQVEASA